jgi:signal transduction histidine kinase/DNA-binding NarL/FixJ family response regulator
MAGALYVYERSQKIYPGFKYWRIGSTLVAISYVLFMVRGIAPDWLTIPGANTLVMVSAVFRIEGMKLFVGRKEKFNYWNFWIPALTLVWYTYFTYADNNLPMRSVLFTILTVFIVLWICKLLLSNAWKEAKGIAYFFVGVLIVYMIFLIQRAVGLFTMPADQSMNANTIFNSAYFLVTLISDITFSVTFILLNGQRTNIEVQALTNDLLKAAADRQQAEEDLYQKRLQMIALEERERMGRDLHDGLGQSISFLNMQMQTAQSLIREQNTSSLSQMVERMSQIVSDANADVRRYILGLRTATKTNIDLYSALITDLKGFETAWKIETRFSPPTGDIPALSDMVKDQILRIVQEALTNIRKHAQAKRVEIFASQVEDALTFIINDDGRGFDLQNTSDDSAHFGLKIMRERAELFGGKLELRSEPGKGTQVLIYVPFVDLRADEDETLNGLRVLLVDDHPLMQEGMRALLSSRGVNVIGTASDGLQALEVTRILRPDLIVMDVEMPNCNGLEATKLIKTEFPETKIVMMTVSEEDEYLLEAVKNGASGYVLKTMNPKNICSMLADVARGETVIAQSLAARMIKDMTVEKKGNVPLGLNSRQWDVLRMAADGLTYKEIGHNLSLTERSVKYHMKQILDHLHVETRDQAIQRAREIAKK